MSEKILELIKENQNISIPEMAKIIDISEHSIERNIENLKKKELLKRVGPAKDGYWISNWKNTIIYIDMDKVL